jgi:hypothetical protein
MLLEDRIRELCAQAIGAKDEQDATHILEELRIALRQHLDNVQDKLMVTSRFSARPRISAKHISAKKVA